MKNFLLDSFNFNNQANLQMLAKIKTLAEPQECARHFSHLINSQVKWMERIKDNPDSPKMSWWEPQHRLDELEERWKDSVNDWIQFLGGKSEIEVMNEVVFTGYDGARWAAKISDIALQLNYHSFHHRAQMQLFIRAQGIEPDFIDYIGDKYRRIG